PDETPEERDARTVALGARLDAWAIERERKRRAPGATATIRRDIGADPVDLNEANAGGHAAGALSFISVPEPIDDARPQIVHSGIDLGPDVGVADVDVG